MNKLVSKNSVLRFKQGKKINFLLKGSIFLGQGILKDWRETKGLIDDDSWNSLIELGYNGERNALSALKYLNSLGLGQLFGQRISEDNAWGNLSRYALNHFLQLKRTLTPLLIISINDYYKPLSEGSVKAVESTLPLTINILPTVSLLTIAQPTYNRKLVRERIRSLGFNPYSDFSSDDRKILRKYWNGEINELPDNLHWVNFFLKQGGQLVSKNPVLRFKKGSSFKEAHAKARANKLRYFNWTDDKGVTRMYNSKVYGNDAEYESFIDNMNEMSALLPTDTLPKHLGWERNNPTSSELRGNDRVLKQRGTDNILPEVTVFGNYRKPLLDNKIRNRIKIGNKIYARGIALNYPGYDNNKDGLYLKGNKIYKKSLRNGKYVDQEVGVIYKGQLYYDENIYGKPNQYSTSLDNDNVITYQEYRNRLSGLSKNKFMGYDGVTGGTNKAPSELPLTQDMNNVLWFRNFNFKK